MRQTITMIKSHEGCVGVHVSQCMGASDGEIDECTRAELLDAGSDC